MKYKWLNKSKNNKLIIFFNGWGMDENIVKHLQPEGYDVLMFYDYNSLETDFNFSDLDHYSEKNLVAWSMGVMVGSCFSKKLNLIPKKGSFVAINGTLKPIDIEYGIHPKIYDLTIKGFNEKGRTRFISSMFDTQCSLTLNHKLLSEERKISEQLTELVALKNYKSDEEFKYDKILISNNDKIIPTKSQTAYWGIEPNLIGGHCPFFQFTKWSELL